MNMLALDRERYEYAILRIDLREDVIPPTLHADAAIHSFLSVHARKQSESLFERL